MIFVKCLALPSDKQVDYIVAFNVLYSKINPTC